jgi:hypothetical protein
LNFLRRFCVYFCYSLVINDCKSKIIICFCAFYSDGLKVYTIIKRTSCLHMCRNIVSSPKIMVYTLGMAKLFVVKTGVRCKKNRVPAEPYYSHCNPIFSPDKLFCIIFCHVYSYILKRIYASGVIGLFFKFFQKNRFFGPFFKIFLAKPYEEIES